MKLTAKTLTYQCPPNFSDSKNGKKDVELPAEGTLTLSVSQSQNSNTMFQLYQESVKPPVSRVAQSV
jgi:hypothetical protein